MSLYDTDRPFQGPHNETYRRIAAELSQLPGVKLHGNVLQAQLAREYMRSAVFVYPNVIDETCCITALEAQAAGCPIVASRSSALPETVGDAGVLVSGEPGSDAYVDGFTAAVARLLEDDAWWAECSRRGHARAFGSFTWQHVAQKFLEIVS